MSDVAIGIDLGTTYSVVAVFKDGQAHVIHNKQGSHTTPSCVSFTDTERLVGEPAKDKAIFNPENTIYGVKRFLGRSYDDTEFQQHLLSFSYHIKNKDNKPIISVDYKKQHKNYAPEEISAMILELMKQLAETYLNAKVTKAVITVPAHFNDAQRQATKDAGRIAGLEVMRIINEPTAAALAYGLNNKYKEMKGSHTILVYDFGGGTFDVSIINIQGGVFEVKSTNGEAYLGGDDIDINLTNHFIKEFKQKNNIDLNKNKKAVRRLRHQCEKLKKNLSFSESANVDLEVIHIEGDKQYDLNSTLTRIKFEQINAKIFDKTLDCVKKSLKDAKLKREDINEVILVGGSSRIPRVRDLVQKFFKKDLNASLNPDEAVAQGAAIQAAILTEEADTNLSDVLLYDVNPLSLGIEVYGGEMSVIIPRNSQIPVCKTERYETSEDFTTNLMITVYEGEGTLVCRNRKLGQFTVTGFPARRRGQVQFDVSFDIDVNGILNVTAVQIDGKIKKNLEIKTDKGHLSEEEIQRMIDEAEKHREEDEKIRKMIRATLELQNYVSDLKEEFMSLDLNDKDNKFVMARYETVLEWLDSDDVTAEECKIKKKQLADEVVPVLQKYKHM